MPTDLAYGRTGFEFEELMKSEILLVDHRAMAAMQPIEIADGDHDTGQPLTIWAALAWVMTVVGHLVHPEDGSMTPTEQTLNISSTSNDWRGLALSNFGLSPFVLDGVLFASVEGFIQGIKFRESDPQRDAAFASSGWPAKHLGDTADRSGAYWDGACLPYGSPEHHRLIERAIRARIAQSKGLQAALKSTVGLTLNS